MKAPLHLGISGAPDSGQAYWITTSDQKRIRFAVWSGGGRGTVLVLPGRGEYIEKYGQVIQQIVLRGFCCVVLDWRGQGLSDRFGSRQAAGYVDDYAHYQHDIRAVLSHESVADLPKSLHVISHSMGGLIAKRCLIEGLGAKTAIFSAPMWGMGFSPVTRAALRFLAWGAIKTGNATSHVIGTSKEPYILNAKFNKNKLMGDKFTFDWFKNQLVEFPELGLGGPSWMWLSKSHAEVDYLADKQLPNIPILTFKGSEENVVAVDAIDKTMSTTKNGRLVVCPSGRHEVFMETPDIRNQVWSEIDAFLSLNSAV